MRKLIVWITFFAFLLLSYQDVVLYINGYWNWVYYGFVIFSILMMTWCFIVLLIVDPGKPREYEIHYVEVMISHHLRGINFVYNAKPQNRIDAM